MQHSSRHPCQCAHLSCTTLVCALTFPLYDYRHVKRQPSIIYSMYAPHSFTHPTTYPSPLLQSDATRRPPASRRNPLVLPSPQRLPPTIDTQHPVFLRLSNFLHLSSRTNAVPRVQPRNPLDVGGSTIPVLSLLTQRWNHRFPLHYPYHPLSQDRLQLSLIRSVFNFIKLNG